MSTATTIQDFLARYPETRYLDLFYCDLSCVMRGKRYPVNLAEKPFSSGVMTPGSGFLLAVNGESMDPEGMGFSDGDPDEVGRPLLSTLAPMPWAQIPTAQVMLTLEALDGTPYYFEPRNVLARVLERFAETGLRPVVAFELEFYSARPPARRQRRHHASPVATHRAAHRRQPGVQYERRRGVQPAAR